MRNTRIRSPLPLAGGGAGGEDLRPPRPLRPPALTRSLAGTARAGPVGRSRSAAAAGSGRTRPPRGGWPSLPFSGDADLDRKAAEGGVGHALDDLLLVAGRDLEEGEAGGDVERADLLAGNARLIGDGSHDVARAHARDPAG